MAGSATGITGSYSPSKNYYSKFSSIMVSYCIKGSAGAGGGITFGFFGFYFGWVFFGLLLIYDGLDFFG